MEDDLDNIENRKQSHKFVTWKKIYYRQIYIITLFRSFKLNLEKFKFGRQPQNLWIEDDLTITIINLQLGRQSITVKYIYLNSVFLI